MSEFQPMGLQDLLDTLEGVPYKEGRDDCYGLVRKFYSLAYDIHLRNYARPGDFAYAGVNLISWYFKEEGFKIVDVAHDRLQIGDVLLMRIGNRCPHINHLAVAVEASRILHHVVDAPSVAERMNTTWSRRIMGVVRHPDVFALNQGVMPRTTIDQFLPEAVIHARQKLIKPVGPDA